MKDGTIIAFLNKKMLLCVFVNLCFCFAIYVMINCYKESQKHQQEVTTRRTEELRRGTEEIVNGSPWKVIKKKLVKESPNGGRWFYEWYEITMDNNLNQIILKVYPGNNFFRTVEFAGPLGNWARNCKPGSTVNFSFRSQPVGNGSMEFYQISDFLTLRGHNENDNK